MPSDTQPVAVTMAMVPACPLEAARLRKLSAAVPGTRFLVANTEAPREVHERVLLAPVGATDGAATAWVTYGPGAKWRIEDVSKWTTIKKVSVTAAYPGGGYELEHFEDAIEDADMVDFVAKGRAVSRSAALRAGEVAAAAPIDFLD